MVSRGVAKLLPLHHGDLEEERQQQMALCLILMKKFWFDYYELRYEVISYFTEEKNHAGRDFCNSLRLTDSCWPCSSNRTWRNNLTLRSGLCWSIHLYSVLFISKCSWLSWHGTADCQDFPWLWVPPGLLFQLTKLHLLMKTAFFCQKLRIRWVSGRWVKIV